MGDRHALGLGHRWSTSFLASVRYVVADDVYDLSTGDAIWHGSDGPHRWESPNGDAVTLHVNTPPAR